MLIIMIFFESKSTKFKLFLTGNQNSQSIIRFDITFFKKPLEDHQQITIVMSF